MRYTSVMFQALSGLNHMHDLCIVITVCIANCTRDLKISVKAKDLKPLIRKDFWHSDLPPKQKTSKIIIKVLQGKDLAAKDLNGNLYLTIMYGPQTFKTSVQKKTLCPVWTDQTFVLPVANHNQILVEYWDCIGGVGDKEWDSSERIPEDGSPLKRYFDIVQS